MNYREAIELIRINRKGAISLNQFNQLANYKSMKDKNKLNCCNIF